MILSTQLLMSFEQKENNNLVAGRMWHIANQGRLRIHVTRKYVDLFATEKMSISVIPPTPTLFFVLLIDSSTVNLEVFLIKVQLKL